MAIVEVIQYNGTPDVFAWKYPNHELGTWTQLIVNKATSSRDVAFCFAAQFVGFYSIYN